MPTHKRDYEAKISTGKTSILLAWVGEGAQRKLAAHIVRDIPQGVLADDPDALERWSIEELIALKTLIEKAENHAISQQSVNLRLAGALAAAAEENNGEEE